MILKASNFSFAFLLFIFYVWELYFDCSQLILQAKALISRLTEEKNNAIQQNNKLRQELVRIYKICSDR